MLIWPLCNSSSCSHHSKRLDRLCYTLTKRRNLRGKKAPMCKEIASTLAAIVALLFPMKTQSCRSRRLSIPNSRWSAYAAAGAATAAVVLPTAEAEVHYSGIVNHKFAGTNQVSSGSFPLDPGANLWLQHFNLGTDAGGARVELLGPNGRQSDSIGGLVGNFVQYGGFYVSNLAPHVSLSRLNFGAYCRFTSTGAGSTLRCFGGTIGYSDARHGEFNSPGIGYIGFTFDRGAGPQYGWARISTVGATQNRFILRDYAWADPGENILIGQKRSSDPASNFPKRGSLGLLALGSAGLIIWRQRRKSLPNEN